MTSGKVHDSSDSEDEESEESADVQGSDEKTAPAQSSSVSCRQRGESPQSKKVLTVKNQVFAYSF